MIWRAGRFAFEFPGRALMMGIVNVTPDSFSDGGLYFDPIRAVEHGLELEEEGAAILDIGGESTRPRAAEVSEDEELRRVIPVIERLREKSRAALSIDTQKPEVARRAVEAGADIVNDIAANRADPAMWEIAARAGAGYVLMHMQGTPRTMQQQPVYGDVVAEVLAFFEERLRMVQKAGVPGESIVLDPGIGFGKTAEHNLQLLASLKRFTILQRPLLLGASRKSFIGTLLGAEMSERLPGSIACALWAVRNGVQIVRTHDVRATGLAVRTIEEIAARGSRGEMDSEGQ